jgi:1-acyl-sn-glycerol-3-phosphate acyltransferase
VRFAPCSNHRLSRVQRLIVPEPVTRPLAQRVVYAISHGLARFVATVFFRTRVHGRDLVPTSGGVLVCANHQSYLDPVLVGLSVDRRLNYLARDTLFRNRWFAWLIRFYDAIPIEREGSGLSGLKETLRRLKRGEMVLIFPEGTRTQDGEISPLKPGFCSVARRANVPLCPVGFDGPFQAWPKGAVLPRLNRVSVFIGPAIEPSEIAAMSDEQLVAELQKRMAECHRQARAEIAGAGLTDITAME